MSDLLKVVLIVVLSPALFLAWVYFSCKLRRKNRRATPEQRKEVAEIAEMLRKGKGRRR